MSNNIAFLFGAGVSQRSLIGTEELTSKIFEATNIVHLSSRYLEMENPKRFDSLDIRDYVPKVKELFNIIQNSVHDHYLYKKRGLNYEDMYYLINALYDDESGEYVNPIISKYCDDFRTQYRDLFKTKYPLIGEISLMDLTREALNYIQDIVIMCLDKPNASIEHLKFLAEVDSAKSISKINIFTLNHDVLIENFFKKIDAFSDGFHSDGYGHRIWSPENFNKRISLLKLHGSINWYRILGKDYYEDRIGIYEQPQRNGDRPLMLIGSFNKLHAYSRSINFDLQCLFAKQLSESDDLIISGYSFGDQGINSRIINWVLASRNRRIFLIHKNPDELIKNARPAIQTNFSFLNKNGNIFYIKEYIDENTTWIRIKSFINNWNYERKATDK
ncbi:MAG: hypothetical protein A2315_04015 [Ignavibacteria bacterium RIFOXYB2_FULL_35_12]|nr:MAG: hypothetical protein A2058_01060 [Ignavibacteria bacterium GWA2_36_19]OGU53326.1 MAG: hypothetical protein A2006_11150 [Ignavibacteria bacterium GWC2_35_8]OGU58404.1 MAG: hypothetical protein A2X60_05675 [Ignavibacteria bacterium GWF2_35_20]OGU86598.1 MAG: hypothetical protein A2492_01855 [Ignavibacteria bacterium RIFOXYC12_FULL_35_11]OGU92136.1 MAG: hypothetical protein A3K31_05975 [Ignavibacteria bacterium RIFOXYA12_FULL_35_25]OGU93312.1 MAG: hypothetical protein A2347_07145 [Ignavib